MHARDSGCEADCSSVRNLERLDDRRAREMHEAFTITFIAKSKCVSDTSVSLLEGEMRFLPRTQRKKNMFVPASFGGLLFSSSQQLLSPQVFFCVITEPVNLSFCSFCWCSPPAIAVVSPIFILSIKLFSHSPLCVYYSFWSSYILALFFMSLGCLVTIASMIR